MTSNSFYNTSTLSATSSFAAPLSTVGRSSKTHIDESDLVSSTMITCFVRMLNCGCVTVIAATRGVHCLQARETVDDYLRLFGVQFIEKTHRRSTLVPLQVSD